MDTLQKALQHKLAELPRQFLPDLLDEKLRGHGIKLSKRKLTELADRILNGEIERFELPTRTGVDRKISIEFTDSDLKWIEEQCEKTLEDLPKLIQSLSETISSQLLKSLKRRWRGESDLQKRELQAFRKRLQKRWDRGLKMLRMQLAIAREFGDGINRAVRESGETDTPRTFEVLTRLHARACQVADEILCLLEGGFADGAMARWRTLHEIAAVGYLIRHHGEELAERYEEHDAIESRRAAHQYQQHCERLGQPPLTKEELAQLDARRAALLVKYGHEFDNPQGWAAKHIAKQSPTIAQIHEAAGVDHLGPYYRMASHNVHANPKGVNFKLGLFGEEPVLLAGPSNAGLTDPGHATAISLNQVSSVLLEFLPNLDHCVTLLVMHQLEGEIGPALLAAQHRLEADHEEFSKTSESAAP
jgi:hypothetical protein